LWGDGLCSGVSDLFVRPPWNYHLMCAGYLLSVLPALLLLIGMITSLWHLFRELRTDIFRGSFPGRCRGAGLLQS
jgi:hypothetical protein